MRIIYADNNATTKVAPEVYEAMAPFLTEDYFNPSSMYEPARRTAAALAQARRQIAGHFHVGDPKQMLFTSCATESNNTAILGLVRRIWSVHASHESSHGRRRTYRMRGDA